MCPLEVPQQVAAIAQSTPDAVAVSAEGAVLTYGSLEARASALARRLLEAGLGPETVAGLCLARSPEMVVAALAILKTGGAYLPLDPVDPAGRIGFMLEDSQARVLVAEPDQAARLPQGRWRLVSPDPGAVAHPVEGLPAKPAPNHLAYVIYTSGSTGQPKGVEITHRSLGNLVLWHRQAFDVTCTDRASHLAGLGFDAAVWELWPYLTAGAAVYLVDDATRQDPERLRDWLLERQITIAFVPTPLAERMLRLNWPRKAALRVLLTGGDRLHDYPPPGLPFHLVNNYGPTEAAVVATSGAVPPGGTAAAPPIGRPIANTQIHILDEEKNPVEPGAPGEIYIGGAGLARGYRNRPELTAERFVEDGSSPDGRLYRTGDLGRLLPDGQIAFLGRIDNQVKIRGYRIEPDEIAAVLRRHAAVEGSVVVPREDGSGDVRLAAYVVPRAGADLSARELKELLRAHLPEYMIPSALVRLEALPLTPNGKVDRAALPAPSAANTLRERATAAAARTPVEERLARLLADLLGLEDVGVEDNFFLLGGHSFLGAQLIARVREAFGVEMPLRILFDHPTVASMSAEIERLIVTRLENREPKQRAIA